uniref:Uncharacterized protein n=1 Tax=Escherichia coli TaxID=562 RepID=A0A6G6AKD8_ECOLX|nr:hypothetical protein [Escherichia coli]
MKLKIYVARTLGFCCCNRQSLQNTLPFPVNNLPVKPPGADESPNDFG